MWPRLAVLTAMCLTVPGCATGPDKNALVKDEATAIAIGKKACAENYGNLVRFHPEEQKWSAHFERGDGFWWVTKSFDFGPPGTGSAPIGLMLRVHAMSGNAGPCGDVGWAEEGIAGTLGTP